MELNIYGLKCDNVTCDYQDESIQLADYPQYLNHPCPKCGQSLLTEADYRTTMQLVQLVNVAKQLGFDASPADGDDQLKVHVALDGTGVPKFHVEEV